MGEIRKIFFCFSFVFLCFFINIDVYAFNADPQGGANYRDPNNTGGGGGGSNGFCDDRGYIRICGWQQYGGTTGGFRFSLVDRNGNLVAGTHSVDFIGDAGFYNKIVDNNYEYENANHYFHKYGLGNNGSGNNVVPPSHKPVDSPNFIFLEYNSETYQAGITHNYGPTPNNFASIFIPSITSYNASRYWSWTNAAGRSFDLSFIDYFLHKCGYLDSSKAFLSQFFDKKNEIALQKYYLIAEPLYEEGYNYVTNGPIYYKYGTINEFVYNIVNHVGDDGLHGRVYGLTGDATNLRAAGCYFYTNVNDGIRQFSNNLVLSNGANACVPIECSSGTDLRCAFGSETYVPLARRQLYYTSDPSYGYGVFTFKLSEIIIGGCEGECCDGECEPPETEPEEVRQSLDVNIDLDLCGSNDGSISVKHDVSYNDYNFLLDKKNGSYIYKVSGDGDSSVYCYDDVTYDFTDAINKLSQRVNSTSLIEFNSPTLNVTRTCIYKHGATTGYAIDRAILDDYLSTTKKPSYINMYYNNTGYLFRLYGDFLNPSNNDIVINNNSLPISGGIQLYDGNKYDAIRATYKAHYYYDNVYNRDHNSSTMKMLVSYSDYSGDAFVDFGNQVFLLFGNTNNILQILSSIPNQTMDSADYVRTDGNVTTTYTTTYKVVYKDGNGMLVDYLRCDFNSSVNVIEPKVRYRLISLDNPFPARDGSSRMPSSNWLNDKQNKVYDYIIRNRGVIGENIYTDENIEPMYTVVLTPASMLKIRKYNKLHQYDSMYSEKTLNCNSNNRECFSTFLRDGEYVSSDMLSGSCVITNDTNSSVIRSSLNSYDILEDYDYSYYERYKNGSEIFASKYDLNYNGRIDDTDFMIYADYSTKLDIGLTPLNSKFYTCANKSYYSGGPFQGVDYE